MNELLKKLRKLVNDGIKEGRDKGAIMKDIDALLRAFNVSDQQQQLYAKMEKQYDWITSHTASTAERKVATELIGNAGAQYTRVKTGLRQDIASRIQPLLEAGQDKAELKNELESVIGKTRNYAETIARTAISGFDSANNMMKFKEAGYTRFRYTGPPAERDFCQELMDQSAEGKTWTEAEIHELDNGQGLDAFYYKGGFYCRHDWEGVE